MFKNKTCDADTIKVEKSITVSFHNLVYEVEQKLDDVPLCGKKGMKDILKGISGIFPPGLNAIMGPTGSGKTSLLDILAKRKDPKGLKQGTILLNGEKIPHNFQLMSGYVVQDDIVMGTLTVRENLAFSANLRLSAEKMTDEERAAKVEEVIQKLGLQECADTKVGTELIRGVSGGERKRVNIGMELVLDPPVMFLDEPTTGLDSNTANSILLLLYKFAKQGKNIILSIHQPRYSIFSLFDELMVLRLGEIVYRGPCKSAVEHFESVGYPCPMYHNPADFFLDIVGGDSNTAQLLGRMQHASEESEHAEKDVTVIEIEETTQAKGSEDEGRRLVEKFKMSAMAQQQESNLQNLLKKYESSRSGITEVQYPHYSEYPNGFFRQFNIVSRRTFLNLIRNPITSFAQIFMMIFFGLLIGLIYFQVDDSSTGLQNRTGCFFFLIMMQVMSNLSALELFIHNRKFFMHESASGYYRVSVHFLSSVFADLLPNRIVPNLCFCTIVYFMIGFKLDAGNFFFFILALISTALAATTAAFLVSASVEVFALANIVLAVPFLLMMMFGGFLVNTGTLLNWLEWIKYISIFKYGYDALVINEMTGLVFYDNKTYEGFDPTSPTPCIDTITRYPLANCITGEDFMDMQDILYGTKNMWINIVALLSMMTGFLILAYIQMRRVNKYK